MVTKSPLNSSGSFGAISDATHWSCNPEKALLLRNNNDIQVAEP